MVTRRLAFASAVLAAAGWSAQAATWDLPTYVAENEYHVTNHKAFADEVRKATGGAIDVKIHAANSLFKQAEIRGAVRAGTVPIGEILLSSLGNENPVFEADSVPFLASSFDEAWKLRQAASGHVQRLLDRDGLLVFYTAPFPPQGLFMQKPLAAVADFKGLKFRTYNTMTARMAELTGAVPTQVAIGDVASAFTTGRIEGMVTSPSTGVARKVWDFTGYYYHTAVFVPLQAVLVNKRAFARLDKKSQDALLAAARKAEDRGWKMAREATDKAVDTLKTNGMKGITPAPALMADLKKIGDTMTAEWAKKAGADAEAILKAYRGR